MQAPLCLAITKIPDFLKESSCSSQNHIVQRETSEPPFPDATQGPVLQADLSKANPSGLLCNAQV